MQTQTGEQPFCTTKEASLLLGVSVGTIQHGVNKGLLDAWKTKGGYRPDNAAAACVQMGRSCPDLLPADLRMPGQDGRLLDIAESVAECKQLGRGEGFTCV